MSPELVNTLIGYALRVVAVIVVLIVAFAVAKWARKKTRQRLEKSPRMDLTLSRFFAKLVYYAILLFAVLACLTYIGFDVTSLVAVLAAAGFAVGLAFQGSLSNFAAGIMLLVFRPFKVGDTVEVADVTGKVHEIELFTTVLDTPDNRRIIVPNGEIYGSTIENKTFHPIRRVDVAVGTDYDTDLQDTRETLERTAREVEGGLEDPAPVVYLDELGGSAIGWSVRVWSKTSDYWDVRERLTNAIKGALDGAEIGMPYPQMDIHLDGALEGQRTDGHSQAEATQQSGTQTDSGTMPRR